MKIILDQRLVVSDSKLNEYEKVIDKKDEQITILEKKLASEKKWGKVKTVVSVIATAAILLAR
jgi:U3 small nucleolar ribonucleoprotein component